MKKYFIIFIVFLNSLIGLSSCCSSYGFSNTPDVDVIVSMGTPFYYNNQLMYYRYNGLYYYPFYYDYHWYFRPYPRPFRDGYRPPFRPNPNDINCRRYGNGFNRPRPNHNWDRVPQVPNHNRTFGNQPRSFGGNHVNGTPNFGGGHFGGHR